MLKLFFARSLGIVQIPYYQKIQLSKRIDIFEKLFVKLLWKGCGEGWNDDSVIHRSAFVKWRFIETIVGKRFAFPTYDTVEGFNITFLPVITSNVFHNRVNTGSWRYGIPYFSHNALTFG